MKKKLLRGIAVLSMLVASLVATSACYWTLYQPEEPECLRK